MASAVYVYPDLTNKRMKNKCYCCVVCSYPVGLQNDPSPEILLHFQQVHPYLMLPRPSKNAKAYPTWKQMVRVCSRKDLQIIYSINRLAVQLQQTFNSRLLQRGYQDGFLAAQRQQHEQQQMQINMQNNSTPHQPLAPTPWASPALQSNSFMQPATGAQQSTQMALNTTTPTPLPPPQTNSSSFHHELCFDKPPRQLVTQQRRRRWIENVFQSSRLSWILRNDRRISSFHTMKPVKMSGNPSFGSTHNKESNEGHESKESTKRREDEGTPCRTVSFTNRANVVVWLDDVTLYPLACSAFSTRTFTIRRAGNNTEERVPWNSNNTSPPPRMSLLPGDALDVTYTLQPNQIPCGSHYQWILLHFSYIQLEASYYGVSNGEFGPSLQHGIDLLDKKIQTFTSGTAFQVNIVQHLSFSPSTANALNPNASAFLSSKNLLVFDSLSPCFEIDNPNICVNVDFKTAMQRAIAHSQEGFPSCWTKWKKYHQALHATESASASFQSKMMMFNTYLKATYSLSDEFNYVRPSVADSCHLFNKLYWHKVITRSNNDPNNDPNNNPKPNNNFNNNPNSIKTVAIAYQKAQLCLLNAEELRQRTDMLGYDLHNAVQVRLHENNKDGIILHVPGVSHQRPPIMENMKIRFRFNPEHLERSANHFAMNFKRCYEHVFKMNASSVMEVRQKEINYGFGLDHQVQQNSTTPKHKEWKDTKVEWIEFTGHVVHVNNTTEEVTLTCPSLNADVYSAQFFQNKVFVESAPILHVRFPFQGAPLFDSMRAAVVQCTEHLPDLLFPGTIALRRTKDSVACSTALIQALKKDITWIDQDLNPKQKNAVAAVLSSWETKGDQKSTALAQDLRKETELPLPRPPPGFAAPSLPPSNTTTTITTNNTNDCRRPMHCILGPPGTGKTRTLLECVMQLAHQLVPPGSLNKCTKLLVAAPSPVAADIICQRLAPYFDGWNASNPSSGPSSKQRMLRLNAVNRPRHWVVMPKTLKHCIPDGSSFGLPTWAQVMDPTLSVIVCTCAMSSYVSHLIETQRNAKTSNTIGFDYVIIDEAAQALEAEALIAVQCARRVSPRVVLFGDPLQLGAQVRSPVAEAQGLGMSLLERLTRTAMYGRSGVPKEVVVEETSETSGTSVSKTQKNLPVKLVDPLMVTNLEFNYRAHNEILSVSNDLFYGGILKACGDPKITDVLCDWSPSFPLPSCISVDAASPPPSLSTPRTSKNCPLWVIGVNGQDAHDIDSPSFFNDAEVAAVVDVVDQLIRGQPHKQFKYTVAMSDLGIIAPYWAHVRKIRLALRSRGYGEVRVGLVEDYQGQECNITIVSTVLSRPRRANLSFMNDGVEENHSITLSSSGRGILGSPKGFNVALSRAKALSIVVGHPVALEADIYARRLLLKCLKEGSYGGMPCSQRIQREAGILIGKDAKVDSFKFNENLLDSNVGEYVDHLTELSLAYRGNRGAVGTIGELRVGEDEEDEEDVILLQPTDFSAFYSGNQAFRNYLS